eukprot:g6986.t1
MATGSSPGVVILWCALAWLHGATVGTAIGDYDLLVRFLWVTSTLLVPVLAAWRYRRLVRLAAAWSFLVLCTYVMLLVKSAVFYLKTPGDPGDINSQPLPDLGHDLLVGVAAAVTPAVRVPLLGVSIAARALPDVLMTLLVIATGIFVITQRQRLVIARRLFVISGVLLLIRAIVSAVTFVPGAGGAQCHASDDSGAGTGSHSLHPKAVVLRTISLLVPTTLSYSSGLVDVTGAGEQGRCRDIFFSGEALALAMCAVTWHTYYPSSRQYINRVKLCVWAWAVGAMALLLALRLHYTLDVLLAVYFSTTVTSAYHRLADDVRRGHAFVSKFFFDEHVVLPWMEWLEDMEEEEGEEEEEEVRDDYHEHAD